MYHGIDVAKLVDMGDLETCGTGSAGDDTDILSATTQTDQNLLT